MSGIYALQPIDRLFQYAVFVLVFRHAGNMQEEREAICVDMTLSRMNG